MSNLTGRKTVQLKSKDKTEIDSHGQARGPYRYSS